jgi:hypothetical protein
VIRYEAISAIGAFTKLSNSVPDYLAIDPSACSGGGDADVRTTEEDAPGADGSLIEPPLDSAQIITLAGDLVVTSTGLSSEAGYKAAVETLFEELRAALNTGKAAPINLVHPGGTLKVWKHGRLDDSWPSFWVCRVMFSVIVDVFA